MPTPEPSTLTPEERAALRRMQETVTLLPGLGVAHLGVEHPDPVFVNYYTSRCTGNLLRFRRSAVLASVADLRFVRNLCPSCLAALRSQRALRAQEGTATGMSSGFAGRRPTDAAQARTVALRGEET